jgi:serine O-acetyltransferase
MWEKIKEEIDVVFERDPAVRSRWEVISLYPGFHAILLHRLAHSLWNHGFKWFGRFVSQLSRFLTGIEIHPGATIGRRVFIDHGMGVVIGETAEVGNDCTLYQAVTLGGTSWNKGKRHPTLGTHVIVGAGAKIIGPILIGDGAKIGSNAVVVKPVPAGATVVGIPGRLINEDSVSIAPAFEAYASSSAEDPITQVIQQLVGRQNELEQELKDLKQRVEDSSQKQEN